MLTPAEYRLTLANAALMPFAALLDVLIFPSGTVLTVPDLPEEVDEDAPFWRSDNDENEEYYSDTEDMEEDE